MSKRHPMQAIEWDGKGVIRFRRNPIVDHLLTFGGLDMNGLRRTLVVGTPDITHQDWDQFYQLIGFSVAGAPLADEKTIKKAKKKAKKLFRRTKKRASRAS